MDPSIKPSSSEEDLLHDASIYRRIISRLLYLTISRSDITFFVHKLSQFTSKTNKTHLNAVSYLIRYIKGTAGKFFLSRVPDFSIQPCADADWAHVLTLGGLLQGFVFFLVAH